ncbi:MAG: hypothetical protein CFE26_01185 [Verrucomicrobiales bacterium VVV1]|nr:MAG: hypothetical protein CFE26_01185 [Verrucomicrobiales bacterium VVV1]
MKSVFFLGLVSLLFVFATSSCDGESPNIPTGRFKHSKYPSTYTFSGKTVFFSSSGGQGGRVLDWKLRKLDVSLKEELEAERLYRIDYLERWSSKPDGDKDGSKKRELEEIRKLDWKGYALRHSKTETPLQEIIRIEGPRNQARELESEPLFFIHEKQQLIAVMTGEIYLAEPAGK